MDVGDEADVRANCPFVVDLGYAQVGIVDWHGTMHAFRNLCPHQGGPVCEGVLRPRTVADGVGLPRLEHERPVIICPWHGWEFDLRDGRLLVDERIRLRRYALQISAGRVLLDLGPR